MGQQQSNAPSDDHRSRKSSFSQPAIPPPAKFKDGPLKGRFNRKKRRNKYKSTGGETEEETDVEVLAAGRQNRVNGWFQGDMEPEGYATPLAPSSAAALNALLEERAEESAGHQADPETDIDCGDRKKKKKRSKKNLRGQARVLPTSLGFHDDWAANSPTDIFVTSQRSERELQLPLRVTVSSPAIYVDAEQCDPGTHNSPPPETPPVNGELQRTDAPGSQSSYKRRGPVPRRLAALRTFSSLGVNSPRDDEREEAIASMTDSELSRKHIKYLKGNDPVVPVNDSQVEDLRRRPPVPKPRRPVRPLSMPCPPPPPPPSSLPGDIFRPTLLPTPPKARLHAAQAQPELGTMATPNDSEVDHEISVSHDDMATDVLEDVVDDFVRDSGGAESTATESPRPESRSSVHEPTTVSPRASPPVSATSPAPASQPQEDCSAISVVTNHPAPRPLPRHTATMTVGIGGVRRVSSSTSGPLQVASAMQPVAPSAPQPVSRAPAPRRPLLLRVPYEHWTPVPMVSGDSEKGYFKPVELFNLLNDGQLSPYLLDPSLLLMVDVRDTREYHEHHIVTSVHREDLDKLSTGIALSDYTHIILYDTDGYSYSLTYSAMSETMASLQEKGLSPVMLSGGYRTFQARHPYLCSPQIAMNERERQAMLTSCPTEVLDEGLYLGNGDQAENVSVIVNLGITHIVNISRERGCPFRKRLTYLPLALEDEPSAQIGRCFQEASQFIYDALGAGGHVLVHCNLGVSRSSTIVLAYLMFTKRCTLEAAYRFLKARRPTISPNRGFWRQLSAFEKKLYGKKLTDPDDLWM